MHTLALPLTVSVKKYRCFHKYKKKQLLLVIPKPYESKPKVHLYLVGTLLIDGNSSTVTPETK